MAINFNGTNYVRYADGKFRPDSYEFGQATPYFTVRYGKQNKDGSIVAAVTFVTPYNTVEPSGATKLRNIVVNTTITTFVGAPIQSPVDLVYLQSLLLSVPRTKALVVGGALDSAGIPQ